MADSWLLLSLYGNVTTLKATEKAQDMIDKALAIDPESAEAFAALGLARWQIGQMDAAESALRHAVDLNEDYIPAQLWLAGVLGELGRYPEENRVLEQAMMKDPLNELLTVNHAANLSIRGDWAAGRALMRDVLELHPDSTMLLRSLAKMELMNGNLVEGWKLANRAYQLQPNNPEDISALAQTWVMLGDAEEAGRLVLKGLETSGQNATLLTTHWMALMVGRRFEEAEALVRELKQQFGEGLPESLERNFNFQLGMIAMVRADYPEARRLLMATIREDEQAAYNDDEVTAVTLASLASRKLGDTEEAQGLLESAERRIRRGRLNGVDNPDIYFNEAILLTMHSEPAKALEKLREAYAKGFRQQWVMEIDGRLDSLRQQPEFITLMNRIRDDVSQARMEIQTLALANL
jgi:tetratricopeptide (TPR) repeat protein